MKRTPQQTSTAINKAVEQINSIIKAHKRLNDYKIITTQPLTQKQIDLIIKEACTKHKVSTKYIKTIIYGK